MFARQPTGTRTEKGTESHSVGLSRIAEVFGCSNPSGPEYPCPTPPRGQLLSHLYKRRGRSSQNAREEKNHEVHDHLERTSQGTPIEYENAQKRILEVFSPWKAPANFKIESFVIRVGDWGGYMLMECDDPLEVHKFCSMLPAFTFEARPVVPVADAIRVELEAMAYRDALKSK
jgi:hypothetical protein